MGNNLVVLGARSDLGSVIIAKAARLPGTKILAVARSRTAAPEAAGSHTVWLTGVDLTTEEGVKQLAEAAAHQFASPFSAVHCVGDFWVHKRLVDTPVEEIRRMIDSHFLTLCLAARALTPLMIERGGGRLVAFSCNSVSYNYPDMAPFTASKAAVESFVRCLAHEYAEQNVSAFAVALPTVTTPKVLQEKTGNLEGYITPEDVADFVLSHALMVPVEASGNTMRLFKYNERFYNTGYFERNPRRLS